MTHPDDRPITILLIEDEALIRLATAAMLEDAGYRILEACDAHEALLVLQENAQIDMVVTDVQMPGEIDGLALISMISASYPGIRTLVTSGRASLKEAQRSGAHNFLPKPYTSMAIESAVEDVLAMA